MKVFTDRTFLANFVTIMAVEGKSRPEMKIILLALVTSLCISIPDHRVIAFFPPPGKSTVEYTTPQVLIKLPYCSYMTFHNREVPVQVMLFELIISAVPKLCFWVAVEETNGRRQHQL